MSSSPQLQIDQADREDLCRIVATNVVALVRLQLSHLPLRLREYSSRDDWCLGYMFGMLRRTLKHAGVNVDSELGSPACAGAFVDLYGEDALQVIERVLVLVQAQAKNRRLFAGLAAGMGDADQVAHGTSPCKSLYVEFALDPLQVRSAPDWVF